MSESLNTPKIKSLQEQLAAARASQTRYAIKGYQNKCQVEETEQKLAELKQDGYRVQGAIMEVEDQIRGLTKKIEAEQKAASTPPVPPVPPGVSKDAPPPPTK